MKESIVKKDEQAEKSYPTGLFSSSLSLPQV
jgi:hypothetical protein